MTIETVMHAVYVKNSFRGRWQLDSLHATRDDAAASSLNVRSAHVWVTELAKPAPETDPTVAVMVTERCDLRG